MSTSLLKYEFHPVMHGIAKPFKFHYLKENTYFSIKMEEEDFEISEPRFPGDDRERRSFTKLVDKYFKIVSKKVEDNLNIAVLLLQLGENAPYNSYSLHLATSET